MPIYKSGHVLAEASETTSIREPLCVMDEDRVQPGAGFGTHGYREMEIITYMLAGELAHRDSIGRSFGRATSSA